jgi:LPXTG-motif cell wall-anchored protein
MRILGIVILVVGVLLLLFGLNSSQVVTEKVVEGLTGRYTETTMWYLIGGIAMIIGGGSLFIFGRSK